MGKALVLVLDNNDEALRVEKDKAEGGRKAFETKYTPYFDWLAKQESQQSQGPAAGEGASEAGPGHVDGGEKAEDGGKHPLDKPVEPAGVDALGEAGDGILEASEASEAETASVSEGYRSRLNKKAEAQYDALGRDVKMAALEAGDAAVRRGTAGTVQPKLDKAVAHIYEHEEGKVQAVKLAADAGKMSSTMQ